MIVLSPLPILGPILAGFVAGVITGGGATRGLKAGFLAGILGALILAVFTILGIGFVGAIACRPMMGAILGGSIGFIILLGGLYQGILGLIGGAVGGALRNPEK